MTDSATLTPAEVRRQKTAHRLTAACRRLTAERGLAGFTVEEVCEEVGISRRTFFNYFPSKEEAVVGVDEQSELQRFAEDFLARPSRGWSAVLDDLAELVANHAVTSGLSVEEHLELHAALEREPKLLARFMGITRERDAQLIELVAHREGVPTADPHARAAVALFGAAIRTAGEQLFSSGGITDFGEALTRVIADMRFLLTDPRKAQP